MKRREFIKNMSATAIGTQVLFNGFAIQALGNPSFEVASNYGNRVLILIRLNGGNDGLNTVIPTDQYTNLAIQRSNVLIPQTSVLPITNDLGFHPVMTGMQNMFNDGKLGVIQNVGYPNQNRSHFRSMDIWSSGLINSSATTGWLGRSFDNDFPNFPDDYPSMDEPDPFAISMGYDVSSTCQGQMANFSHAVNDPFDNFNLATSGIANENTYHGHQLEYLATIIDQTNKYGTRINAASNVGQTLSTKYDLDNPLAQQLQYVAQMISGGLETKVYVLNVNGFDTHDSQVYNTDTTQGTHADLLKTLSDAMEAFQDDLMLLGLEDRVAGFTFSEFGRQIASNASNGTDHGDAGPMFLFGTCISNSIMGSNPIISNTIVNQEAIPMEFDFRNIYASVLKDWFGVESIQIQSLFEHTVTYYNVLDACGSVSVPENSGVDELSLDYAIVYPNPCFTTTTVRINTLNEMIAIRVYDMNGGVAIDVLNEVMIQGQHEIPVDIKSLKSGNFVIRIEKDSGHVVKKLIKA